MVKTKVPYAEDEIFSGIYVILVYMLYARLYDSAASSASPLGSAASLAITDVKVSR